MNQHLVSQVYLKQFGYLDKNNQWKVCVLEKSKFDIMLSKNKRWLSHKSIESFLSKEDFFDFTGLYNENFLKLLEQGSGEVETRYPHLLNQLKNYKKGLSKRAKETLVLFISNLYVRTSNFDLLYEGLAEVGALEKFKNECTLYLSESQKEAFKFEFLNQEFSTYENQKNLFRFMFWCYFAARLGEGFDYYIIEAADGCGWMTSDNPIALLKNMSDSSTLSKETEIIFPVNAKVLLLFRTPYSEDVSDFFRGFRPGKRTKASVEANTIIMNIMSENAHHSVIIPGLQGIYTF